VLRSIVALVNYRLGKGDVKAQRLLFVVLVAVIVAPVIAFCQESPSTFEFSFSNPGARSLGLGGAFAALADDATAAFANPAGLVQLVSLEVSAELRHWRYSTPYIVGGRFEGEPTGIGLDTTDGLRTAVSEEQLTGLSFISLVYPKGKWSFALYSHQLANFRAHTGTEGLFPGEDGIRAFDRGWSTELDIVGYGIAGAYRLSDRFSLGLGIVHFRGRLEAPFVWSLPDDFETLQGVFGPTSYLPESRVADGEMAIDDADWGLSAGLLWGFAERWSVGAFYRQAPEFKLVYEVVGGPLAPIFLDPPVPAGETAFIIETPMQFPDVYGIGLAYRSRDGRFTVGLEWDRVEYSSIFSSFDPVVIESLESELDLSNYLVADDGNEFRVGGEYAFLDLNPVLAFRAGIWIDPDHRFRSVHPDNPEHQTLFQAGEDELHFAVGIGLAFKTFQIDLAADFSDLVDTFSLSAIYGF
jgi:long-subunit fatty acid transport protein